MTSNPFLSALNQDRIARENAKASGKTLVTAAEVGIFYGGTGTPLSHRRIWPKPATIEQWEEQALRNHECTMAQAPSILFVCSTGTSPFSEEGKQMLADLKAGKLALPITEESKSPAHTPVAQRRETNEQLESRLARQREEKRTGVRLEKPSIRIAR